MPKKRDLEITRNEDNTDDKIIVTETLYKDGECPICFDCQRPATGMQIQCNCGCKEIWCQPCFYRHYRDFANDISLRKFGDMS